MNLQKLKREVPATVLWRVALQLLLSYCIYWLFQPRSRFPCPYIICTWYKPCELYGTGTTWMVLVYRTSSLTLYLSFFFPLEQRIIVINECPLSIYNHLSTNSTTVHLYLIYIFYSCYWGALWAYQPGSWAQHLQFLHWRAIPTKESCNSAEPFTTNSCSMSTKAEKLQREKNYRMTFILKFLRNPTLS